MVKSASIVVITCRCNPDGLFFIKIESGSKEEDSRGKTEYRGDFETAKKYDFPCARMIN